MVFMYNIDFMQLWMISVWILVYDDYPADDFNDYESTKCAARYIVKTNSMNITDMNMHYWAQTYIVNPNKGLFSDL